MKKNWIIWSLLGVVIFVASACKDDDIDENQLRKELYEKQVKEIEAYLQSNNITAANAGNGIFQEVVVQNLEGQQIILGDVALVNYKIKTLDGTLVGASEPGKPERIIYSGGRPFFPQLLFYGLGGKEGVHVGGTYRYYAPSVYGLGKFTNDQVPANSNLVLEYEVVGSMRSYAEVSAAEEIDIEAWLEQENLTAEVLSGGLRKIVLKEGTGTSPATGETALVRYKGYLLSKEVFDDNLNAANPYEVKVGSGGSIKGFEQAVRTLKVGEKSLFIMPSLLAYGASGGYVLPRELRQSFIDQGIIPLGTGAIPPLSTLIFEIELIEKK